MAKTIREELKDMYKAKGGQQGDLTNDSQTIQGMLKAINTAEETAKVLTALTVGSPADELDLWGTTVAQIQDDVAVSGDKITGSLYYRSSGQIVTDWGAGYFIALKLSSIDADANKVYCGLDPSKGTGLVDITNDPDKVCLCKLDSKDSQIFKVIQITSTGKKLTQAFSLSGLTLVPEDAE